MITREQFEKHIASVAGGPRTNEELAEAERKYQARVMEGRAELAQAEFEHRRPPGAASVSRMAALKASMPGFARDLASLPEVPEVEDDELRNQQAESVAERLAAPLRNGHARTNEAFLDRDMLKALGSLWVQTKKQQGRAQAWDELEEGIMLNLHRLAPGYGTVKDFIALVRGLDEYSNPVAPKANGKQDKTQAYRRALLMDDDDK